LSTLSTTTSAMATSKVSTQATTSKPSPEWIKICAVEEIPVLGSRRVTRQQGIDVAVFRNDQDEVFALLDRCPHKGGPLSQGIVFGKHVACPLHNWAIALGDGQARAPDEGCTPKFQLKVEAGFVFLDELELASHAIDLPRPQAGPILRDVRTSS
jgi:nitrite reductase (NADH) small subunit